MFNMDEREAKSSRHHCRCPECGHEDGLRAFTVRTPMRGFFGAIDRIGFSCPQCRVGLVLADAGWVYAVVVAALAAFTVTYFLDERVAGYVLMAVESAEKGVSTLFCPKRVLTPFPIVASGIACWYGGVTISSQARKLGRQRE